MADKERSGIEDSGPEAAPQERGRAPDGDRAKRDARRRFLTGGLAGAPVILTLSSRPALATFCSHSGMNSGNASQTVSYSCRGRSPGYWRDNPDRCANYIMLGPCNPIHYSYYEPYECYDYSVPSINALKNYRAWLKNYKPYNWRSRRRKAKNYIDDLEDFPGLDSPPFGTSFGDCFANGLTSDPDATMMQALWHNAYSDLLPQCAAAYLNACEFGREQYGYSHQEISAMVVDMIFSDPFSLRNILDELNDRG